MKEIALEKYPDDTELLLNQKANLHSYLEMSFRKDK